MSVNRVVLSLFTCLLMGYSSVAMSQVAPGTEDTVQFSFRDQTLSVDAVNTSTETYLRVSGPRIPLQKFPLPSDVGSVESISRAFDGRILVLAEASAGVKEVLIYDRLLGSLVDKFLCYRPSISPDGRFIAFTKFFPAHFISEQDATNFLMLYDLREAPEANRGADDAPNSYTDVGVQLYPNTDTESEMGPIHTFMSDRFFWSPDSSRLVLLDQQYSNVAPPTKPVPRSNLHLPPRPTLEFIEVDVLDRPIQVRSLPSTACLVETGVSCMIRLTAVSFGESSTSVALEGLGSRSTVRKSLELHHSDFAPVYSVR